jgi:uncharacterized lipoprotein NlpE involved in copper resistance
MKKTIFLASLLVTLLIAGCNEKNLISQIDGTWHVQKYSVANADQTHWFDTSYASFKWNFSGTKDFFQTWTSVKLYVVYNYDTITHLDTTTHTWIIDSVTSTRAVVPTTVSNTVKGDWYLTNGNQFLETRDSTYGTRLYQIIDHSKSSLHLLDGNKDYYLAK